jgi:hypothetical protein
MFNLARRGFVPPGMPVRRRHQQEPQLGNHRHRDFTLDEFYNDYAASLREGNLIAHRYLADGRIIQGDA